MRVKLADISGVRYMKVLDLLAIIRREKNEGQKTVDIEVLEEQLIKVLTVDI